MNLVNSRSMSSFNSHLKNLVEQKRSWLCVGLDISPEALGNKDLASLKDHSFKVVDATREHAVAYKPNFAFYERYGADGYRVLERLIDQTKGKKLKRISPHLNCEPLLCKDLPEQIRNWKSVHQNTEIDLSTNCVFLTEDKIMELSEAGLDTLEFHFMGVSKNYHEHQDIPVLRSLIYVIS